MKLLFILLVIFVALNGLLASPSRDSPSGGTRGGSSGANGGRGGDGRNRGGAEHGGHGPGDRSGHSRVA
ncbi:hypothetical protein D910_09948 [Dendroctonus ponderosae]